MAFSRIRDQDLVLRAGGNELARVNDCGGHRHRGLFTHTRADASTCATWVEPGNTRAYLAPADKLRPNWVNVNGVWRMGALLESARTNRVENSNYEADLLGTTGQSAAVARDATHPFLGGWGCKVTTTNVVFSGAIVQNRNGTRMPATAAKLHTASFWVYIDPANAGKLMTVSIDWWNAVPAQISASASGNIALAAGWQRLSVTGLAPAGTVTALITCRDPNAEGVWDFWIDLPQFEEAAYASSAIATGTAALARAGDALLGSVFLDLMGSDWTMYLWFAAPHTNVASWADADSTEQDPFIIALQADTANENAAVNVRLHRQNSATTYEWEYGPNTPTASRSFAIGTAPQKLCLRHYASDHHLDASVDGGAFAASGVPPATAFLPFQMLRLGGSGFSGSAGFITLLDLQIAEGLFNPEDMLDPL